MTHPGNVTEPLEAVRRRTIAVLNDLVQKAGELGMPKPPPVIERYRRKLREDACKVLMVGGTKRGKSTFVNALLGRDVLPTGVAASQVFNIRPSREEAYRLRLEDGSEREVSPEDLPLYGSRVATDPFVRWIEVDAPVRFLPHALNLLDMPGGAPFTDRFVPEADAVIFVLESGQPVNDDDLESIEEILDATPHVFFIQTRIDLYDEEDWRNVRRLNQEILAERFEGRLADTRVWPISSTNLRESATGEGEEASTMVSHHRKLAIALRAFLDGVVGWNRVAGAMLVATRYHAASREVFSGQLAGFTAESQQKRSEMQKVAVEGKRRFEEDWGPRGHKCLELKENLQRAIAVGKQSFANTLQMGGDIELAQKAKIDEIQSLTEANRVGKEMPYEVVAAAMKGWARVCKEVQHRCVELLGPFADGSSTPPDPNISGPTISNSGLDVRFKTDYYMMLRGGASGIILLGAASLAVAVTGVSLPPLGLVAIPLLFLLVGGGIRHAHKSQLKTARQELRMHLVEVLQKVRRHFFDVDLMSGRFSLLDEYFSALDRSVNEQVRKMVQKKSKDVDAEIAHLAEATRLGDRERDLRARETHERAIQWDSVGKSARDVMALITEQAADTAALLDNSSRMQPVLRKLDETLQVSPPASDEKDASPGATHTRRPAKPEPVPSSPSPPGSAPLVRYREAVEATPAEGESNKVKANRFDVFEAHPALSGEQAADRLYAELKRQPKAISSKEVLRLRWFMAPAILAALAWGGWFVFMG